MVFTLCYKFREEGRGAFKFLTGKPKGKRALDGLGVDWWTTSKYINNYRSIRRNKIS